MQAYVFSTLVQRRRWWSNIELHNHGHGAVTGDPGHFFYASLLLRQDGDYSGFSHSRIAWVCMYTSAEQSQKAVTAYLKSKQ